MRVAIYPGSFDPITNGHLDIITRGAKVFDKLIVGVLVNIDKVGLFSIKERVELIKRVTQHLPNVEVVSFNGLLVDLAKEYEAKVILKGLRAVTDFEYEFQMALMNSQLDNEVETLFMTTSAANSFLMLRPAPTKSAVPTDQYRVTYASFQPHYLRYDHNEHRPIPDLSDWYGCDIDGRRKLFVMGSHVRKDSDLVIIAHRQKHLVVLPRTT